MSILLWIAVALAVSCCALLVSAVLSEIMRDSARKESYSRESK